MSPEGVGATPEEKDILLKLAELEKMFAALPNPHPDDYDEIRTARASLKKIIMWRVANRADPVAFPGPISKDEMLKRIWSRDRAPWKCL